MKIEMPDAFRVREIVVIVAPIYRGMKTYIAPVSIVPDNSPTEIEAIFNQRHVAAIAPNSCRAKTLRQKSSCLTAQIELCISVEPEDLCILNHRKVNR